MPVADTELLFALNPRDRKHEKSLRILSTVRGIKIPDTAILEFVIVLKARGRNSGEIQVALEALRDLMNRYLLKEAKTIDAALLIKQAEIQERYKLSFFDSLIASSALKLDKTVISDDKAFDAVPELRKIPIEEGREPSS